MSRRVSLLAIALLIAVPFTTAPAKAGTPQYTITNLGDPAGNGMDPLAINVAGQVVGLYQLSQSSNTVAFIWDSVHGVQGIDSSLSSRANAISSSGTVVGYDSNQGSFEWTAGDGVTYFHNFADPENSATGINNSGVICGIDYDEAYTYSLSAGFKLLGFIGTGTYSTAQAINDSGQVAGRARDSAQNDEAGLWDPTSGWTDLGNIQAGVVSGINDSTQIVGSLYTTNSEVPFEWTAKSGLVHLTTFNALGESEALGINNNGAIVGYSYFGGSGTENYDHAAMWTAGQLVDLNSILPSNSGWVLTSANAINDNGQIVGTGYYDGVSVGFLLSPVVPEPASLAIAGITSMALLRRRAR